ncbi:hypothetical protein ACFL2F_02435 [Myxococcota bacterium]
MKENKENREKAIETEAEDQVEEEIELTEKEKNSTPDSLLLDPPKLPKLTFKT